MSAEVHVLSEGYSCFAEEGDSAKYEMEANCSSTLILSGESKIIVDTMTAWDKSKLIQALKEHGVDPEDITVCVGTHGHPDHVGNLNMFTNALHVVGYTMQRGCKFFPNDLPNGGSYIITDDVKIIPTPGHTEEDISVIVKTVNGVVAVAGDLFERKDDIEKPYLWREVGGSQNPEEQTKNRFQVASLVDFIVPGHGPMFKVTTEMKENLEAQSSYEEES